MKKTTPLSLFAVAGAALLFAGCNDYLCLAPPGTTASSKLTICHAKGNGKYNLITVSASAAASHVEHGDFLAPVGAKKASDCVEPVVAPPIDTVVVPPVVVPPVDTVVIPPVIVPPTDTVTPPPPPVEDADGDKVLGDDERENLPCIADDSRPECQL